MQTRKKVPAHMTTQSSPLTLFYAWLLLLLFLAGFFGLIREFLLWKRVKC